MDGVQTWLNPTAPRVLDWLCDPALLRFVAAQNCLYQEKLRQGQELHALEVRLLRDKSQAAEQQRDEANDLAARTRAECEQLRQDATVLRALRRKFPTVAHGVKTVLRPFRRSA